MARFGWAYVNSTDVGSGSEGPNGSLQFCYDETGQTTGSAYLTFYTASGVQSYLPNSLILSGNLYITGTVSASTFHVKDIMTIDATGSTDFGDSKDDHHYRTGSFIITNAGVAPSAYLLSASVVDQRINVGGRLTASHGMHINQDDHPLILGAGSDVEIFVDSDNLYIENVTSNKDIYLRGNDGGSGVDALQLDMSDAGAAIFNSTVSATSVTASSNIYAANGYFSGLLDVEGSVTLGDAAGDVTTITGRLTASQGLSVNVDDYPIVLGAGEDLRIKHDGNSKIKSTSGHLIFDNEASSKDIRFILASDSADTEAVKIRNNSDVNKWVCDAAGNVSGSGTLQAVGNTFLGAALTISGATSAQAITATTYSGSSTLQSVGAAFLGNTLAVSGTVSVAEKIEHAGDTDTYIAFTTDDINFQAGGVNFMDLTEDTQNEVTFNEGGVDVDFRVESIDETHMLFIEGSSNRVSIGDSTNSPAGTLEITNASDGGVPALVINSNDTDKRAVEINAANVDANVLHITADAVTTAKVINISADALTTGNAVKVNDDSSNTGTRQTALIVQNNAAAIAATALHVQSDGGVTGIELDKNYSDTTEASIVGLNIDWDKTGTSTSDNTMYGIQLDMDNTTATNGTNTMYGLHVTPTLTHAADAGTPTVKGAVITATGGTNGTAVATGMELTSTGADTNNGLIINCADGGTDLKILSSADTGDYFSIATTAVGATTITTVDDGGAAADLTFTVDGDIILGPAGGDVLPDGDNTRNLGSAAKRWANVYTGDLHLRNDRGDWTIVEEEDFLCVINNKTGKKFKMNLIPLEDDE